MADSREATLDKQVLALLIPIVAISFTGLVVLSRTRIGDAIARRIAGERRPDREILDHVESMRHELDAVRSELAETQERLDFTERLLSRTRDPGALAAGED